MNSMLAYEGYHALIEFDAEENIFVGEVFGITDSLSFHGTTVEELQDNFRNCIENYFEYCEKVGKCPDKEFKGSFNVRVPMEMHKKAALEAAKQKMTLNQYVVKAIQLKFDYDDPLFEIERSESTFNLERRMLAYYELTSQLICERKRQNLSQEELAEKAGVEKQDIEKLESGNCDVQTSVLLGVVNVLGSQLKLCKAG